MNRLDLLGALVVLCAGTWTGGCGAATYHMRGAGTAFFYGEDPPVDQLLPFPQVVLEPETATPDAIQQIKQRGSTVFAYLAAMEVDRTRPWFPRVKKEWILGKNKAWKSVVLDHLGLVAVYQDLRGALPTMPLAHRYAGIILWHRGGALPGEAAATLPRQGDGRVRGCSQRPVPGPPLLAPRQSRRYLERLEP